MPSVEDLIAGLRIIPVVTLHDAAHAAPLADALIEGGLPIAEITFRTAAAADGIRVLAGRDDFCVGAGTVVSTDNANAALAAGARFLVSPGVNPDVVSIAQERCCPVYPGIATPTELTSVVTRFGLEVVKFFPATAIGGLPMLKALAAPFPNIRFIPTGGINAGNVTDWLDHPKVLAVGGSWMVPARAIAEGRFAEITDLAREAVAVSGVA
ncbi:MAG: 2-dehydro-3-deoxyphosphogluconate aldolase [Planctomycetes bacterium]|nr:2-dehydro-3-deoxyphosphogluconate aldolase [Planctomycetota bacterium]